MAQSKIEKLANYSVLLIALLALVVSFWQVKLFQDHNKLTVKPYLDFNVIQEDSLLNVSFSNKGLGPAIIQSITYEYKGKNYTRIGKLLDAAGELKNVHRTYNYSKNSVVVSNGEKNLLVELKYRYERKVKVKIVYLTIYEEEGSLEFSF